MNALLDSASSLELLLFPLVVELFALQCIRGRAFVLQEQTSWSRLRGSRTFDGGPNARWWRGALPGSRANTTAGERVPRRESGKRHGDDSARARN